jgi:hypothetical protein
MCAINFVFVSCKVKKQDTPGYYSVALEKFLKIHRMEILWTFIGNRMDFDCP